ncbi:tyrosine-type recombinase/integrase [Variovorax rhizosphaerae]|uniref:Integrase arm-type DNA-binding domain-containing protein n=1 Tax=Variovorax rhizosphaerae TaxID=1836200 RepID=A0ABU8WVD8_9BURK
MGTASKLTDVKVKTAKVGRYGDGAGLMLEVRANPSGTVTSRNWTMRFTSPATGKARWMGLGQYPGVSLSDARQAAGDARKLISQGVDPIDQRAGEREAMQAAGQAPKARTFDQAASLLMESKREGWRNPKHRAQWQSTLDTYASPVIGTKAAAAVTFDDVLTILSPIWTAKPETASRVRGRIEAVLDYAAVIEGAHERSNPARWKGRLDKVLPAPKKVRKVEHHAALPFGKASAFMKQLRALPGTSAQALEFTILTAARSGEVRGMTWGELDLDNAAWTVPAERMKAKVEHRVALSNEAIALLRAIPNNDKPGAPHPGDALVFPSLLKPGRPLSDMSLTAVLRRAKVPVTVHGFRSTFRDWAGETTSHARQTVEHALAHRIPDAAEAAYARGSHFVKRRKLMQDWADYLGKAMADVTPIQASKANMAAA